ncbi:type VI secretion system baseplate subunit TssE [Azotobacter chroococcum]|uniref:type VI secretion system baseplate subunit TssE n=1 Tax=Azotobacter chroococcum TaxID=353 RepID=UPI00103AD920|nr:type VI secretion system baseplate subunit TssE [Azotobacter chroococcum]TBW36697.1 type VI secretion system baseplate subunit TssE [Azotobacter chroococcum]
MGASGTTIRPPLFERLAATAEDRDAADFDREALADSVRAELLRLLNTRRGPRPLTTPASVLDYGIADWSALQAERSADRRQLTREIRGAILQFEPRLQPGEIELLPVAGQRQRLCVRLSGVLRGGQQRWPVSFLIEEGADGLEVRHERLD